MSKGHFEGKNIIRRTQNSGVLKMRVGNQWVLFDHKTLEIISSLRWSLTSSRDGSNYARAYVGGGRKAAKSIRMHRLVITAPDGMDVDHINRNTLDNRACNLRVATRSQNLHNTGLPKHNKAGVKGVCWYPAYGKWRATINFKRKQKTLGYFATIETASEARRRAEVEYGV